jgi:hypothetical protein
VQHDVLALLDALDAIDAQQHAVRPTRPWSSQRHRRADQHRVAVGHGQHLAQVVRLQRRAGRDQVADQVGAPQARRDLDRARQRDDLGLDLRSSGKRSSM